MEDLWSDYYGGCPFSVIHNLFKHLNYFGGYIVYISKVNLVSTGGHLLKVELCVCILSREGKNHGKFCTSKYAGEEFRTISTILHLYLIALSIVSVFIYLFFLATSVSWQYMCWFSNSRRFGRFLRVFFVFVFIWEDMLVEHLISLAIKILLVILLRYSLESYPVFCNFSISTGMNFGGSFFPELYQEGTLFYNKSSIKWHCEYSKEIYLRIQVFVNPA